MLIRTATLERIRDGSVTVAFRRWKRPTVRSGGTLLTALGELEIREVAEVDPDFLTEADARAAGFDSLDELRKELETRPDRTCYRIEFGELRPDPRIALREQADLTENERLEIVGKLNRMDERSPDGPWTETTLRLIADLPGVRAGDLCVMAGQERDRFKANVRKLKRLGLTESLEVGYRLSPRGESVLGVVGEDRGGRQPEEPPSGGVP